MGNQYPNKYTVSEIVNVLAENTGITKKQSKEVYSNLINIIKKGVVSGERVPLGDLGKVFAHSKPSTKAREGRNPSTGNIIQIPAKPAHCVPKVIFSKSFKEDVEKNVKP